MKNQKKSPAAATSLSHPYLLLAFGITVIVNLTAEFLDHKTLIYFSKPLLMTWLAIYFSLNTKNCSGAFRNFFLLGLLFSIAGDSFLMLVENEPNRQHFFLLGLGSFLLTHICYVLAFLNLERAGEGWIRRRPWMFVLLFLYLFANIAFLWPGLNPGLKIPVIIYSTAIVAMIGAVINLKGLLPKPLFQIILLGALLFLISDTMIGINKFRADQLSLWQPRLLIMTSYIIGQLFLCLGATRALQYSNFRS